MLQECSCIHESFNNELKLESLFTGYGTSSTVYIVYIAIFDREMDIGRKLFSAFCYEFIIFYYLSSLQKKLDN